MVMLVYTVWYYNPELSNEHTAALWGIYTSYEKAGKALKESGFEGWINEEVAE